MPSTTDPQHLAIILWALLGLGAVAVGLLAWSLRTNFANVSRKLDDLGRTIATIDGKVTSQGTELAVLRTSHDEIRRRVDGLEERERERLPRAG